METGMSHYIYNPIRVTLALPPDVNPAYCDWAPLADSPAPQTAGAALLKTRAVGRHRARGEKTTLISQETITQSSNRSQR